MGDSSSQIELLLQRAVLLAEQNDRHIAEERERADSRESDIRQAMKDHDVDDDRRFEKLEVAAGADRKTLAELQLNFAELKTRVLIVIGILSALGLGVLGIATNAVLGRGDGRQLYTREEIVKIVNDTTAAGNGEINASLAALRKEFDARRVEREHERKLLEDQREKLDDLRLRFEGMNRKGRAGSVPRGMQPDSP